MASDLVPLDFNGVADLFLYDTSNNSTVLLSVNGAGDASANGVSLKPVFSADGRTLFFQSWASDISGEDFNNGSDIFALDLTSLPVTSATNSAPSACYAQMIPAGVLSPTPAVGWSLSPGASLPGAIQGQPRRSFLADAARERGVCRRQRLSDRSVPRGWEPILPRRFEPLRSMNTTPSPDLDRARNSGFTLVELVVVIAVLAILAVLLLPALAATRPNAQPLQCMQNERQIIFAWQMYAEDNSDLLAPNDYPYATAYAFALPTFQSEMRNWVVGTMESPPDSNDTPFVIGRLSELLDPNTVLSPYLNSRAVFRCPADNYLNPNSRQGECAQLLDEFGCRHDLLLAL